MMVEGMGLVEPTPIRVPYTPTCYEAYRRESEKRQTFRQYGIRKDKWGRGFVTDPVLVGLMGEWAACQWLSPRIGVGIQPDTRLHRLGDGGKDIEVFGRSIDVKTMALGRITVRRKEALFRRISADGRMIALPSDYYVVARLTDTTVVDLVGWLHRKDVLLGALERSPVGDHWNLRPPAVAYLPMRDLVDELLSYRGER